MPCPRWPFVASTVSERSLGPNGFNGFSPVDARPDAWSAATSGAAQGERGAGERGEKRREEKGGASPSSPSWMARRDGPWRV